MSKASGGKRRFEPLMVIVRPSSFTPDALKSDGKETPLTAKGPIIPKNLLAPSFGAMPFEAQSPLAATETSPVPPTQLSNKRKRMKQRGKTPANTPVAHTTATLGHIHAKFSGKPAPEDSTNLDEDDADDAAAAAKQGGVADGDGVLKDDEPVVEKVKVVKKRCRCRVRIRCAALTVLGRRLQALTGFGAAKAWKLLNPVSVALGKSLLLNGKDVLKFRASFNEIDLDGSLTVDFDEFFEVMWLTRTPFNDAVFTMIEDPATLVKKIPEEERAKLTAESGIPSMRVRGRLSFDDYFHVCCLFCTMTREEILQFIFNCFDSNKSGDLEPEEYKTLVSTVNGFNPMYPGNFDIALKQFDLNNDGKISYEEFKYLNFKFPMVLFPAFQLQDEMQAVTLGHKRWLKLHENMKMKHYLTQFMTVHSGKLPLLNCWTTTKWMGKDKRYEIYDLPDPRKRSERPTSPL